MKITLCGKAGSGKSVVAKALAKEFKLNIILLEIL